MKKETIIAIILGILFGSGVALFLVFKTNKPEQAKVIPVVTTSRTTPVTAKNTTPSVQTLVISAPEQNSVTDQKEITITGKATKGSLLVIQSPVSNIIETLEKDDFSKEFPVALGENIIQMTVYPVDTKSSIQEKTLVIYHLEEK